MSAIPMKLSPLSYEDYINLKNTNSNSDSNSDPKNDQTPKRQFTNRTSSSRYTDFAGTQYTFNKSQGEPQVQKQIQSITTAPTQHLVKLKTNSSSMLSSNRSRSSKSSKSSTGKNTTTKTQRSSRANHVIIRQIESADLASFKGSIVSESLNSSVKLGDLLPSSIGSDKKQPLMDIKEDEVSDIQPIGPAKISNIKLSPIASRSTISLDNASFIVTSVKRSNGTIKKTKTRSFRARFKKHFAKYRSFRGLIKKLKKKLQKRGFSADSVSDEKLAQKYLEKKQKKSQKLKKRSLGRKLTIKPSKSVVENEIITGGGRINKNAAPALAEETNLDETVGAESLQQQQMVPYPTSELTSKNIQMFSSMPVYKPLQADLIDQYVSEVSKDLELKMEQAHLVSSNALAKDAFTGIQRSDKKSSETMASIVNTQLHKANEPRHEAVEVSEKTGAKEALNNSASFELPSKHSVSTNESSNSLSRKSSSTTTTSNLVDPSFDVFLTNWSSFLKNTIAQRTMQKLDATTQSIGNYTTSYDASSTKDQSIQRLEILDALIDETDEKSVEASEITESKFDDAKDVTDNSSVSDIFVDMASRNVSHDTVEPPRPDSAATMVAPVVNDADANVIADNASLSSNSTIDSVKTSSLSDSKTNYYSINNDDVKFSRTNTVIINKEYHDGSVYDKIMACATTSDESISINRINNNVNSNAKSIFDILSLSASSISDLDSLPNRPTRNAQRAFSDMNRTLSLSSSDYQNDGLKKFCSLSNINEYVLENKVKVPALHGRKLENRYNRKSNNASIVRFLSQQRYINA